jgi:hypothetical protein
MKCILVKQILYIWKLKMLEAKLGEELNYLFVESYCMLLKYRTGSCAQ